MRDFELEVFYTQWEFTSRFNLSATDIDSISVSELLALSDQTGIDTLASLHLGYTRTWGDPTLRSLIADLYKDARQEDVLCFAGAEESLHGLMHAVLGPDDHAIVTTPNYQSAETLPNSICATTGIALDEHNNWDIDVNRIVDAVRPETRLIYVNFPNNPTGKVISKSQFLEIVEIARKNDIVLASDEIFRGQEHPGTEALPQVVDVYENGVSLNGFSKLYALPGIRIGWAASKNHALLDKMERLKHYGSICSSAPSELLAIAALQGKEKLVARNNALGDELMAGAKRFFREHDELFEWSDPDAGYFSYLRYKGRDGVEQFVERSNLELGVLFAPASVFRSELTDTPTDRFRVGFTRAYMPEALELLGDWITRNG